jgi:glycosyltransferase involved in cell wall biosynthesis
MKNPLISVIIPCFNYGAYLQQCLQSVLTSAQDIPKEIIVIDDGSTDNTPEIARQFQEHVTYIHQENAGLSAARNTGMRHATGKYLLFLDADDLLAPNTIPVQTSILETQPDVDIAICQTREVLSMGPDGPMAPIGFWWLVRDSIPLHLCHFNIAPPHAYIIRRHRALENGFFDTTLRACEDYDFWFRCAVRDMQFCSHAQTYVLYRKHSKSMSANKKIRLSMI